MLEIFHTGYLIQTEFLSEVSTYLLLLKMKLLLR